MLEIAVPKGSLFEGTMELLICAGVKIDLKKINKRKLFFFSEDKLFKFIIVRPTDVPVYVEYGAADVGIVGKDVLMETPKDVIEYLDLKFGGCKFVAAVPEDQDKRIDESYDHLGSIRVATKYPNVATEYFYKKGKQVEVIKLYGAIEMAPLMGLSDIIVDISATGRTLKENGLRVIEEIAPSTARFIGNRAVAKLKGSEISDLIASLRSALKVK